MSFHFTIKTIIADEYLCYSDFTKNDIEAQEVLGHVCGKGAWDQGLFA